MTKEMTEEEKEDAKRILGFMLVDEYCRYLKLERPTETIYWNFDELTVREFEKVFQSIIEEKDNLGKVKELVKLAQSDVEFDKWFKKQEFQCPACGAFDLEEKKKLSSYHPEWQKWQEEDEPGSNEALEENERWIVFKQDCLNCGHVAYTSCGSETVEEAKNGIK